jgi:hypothetical protein
MSLSTPSVIFYASSTARMFASIPSTIGTLELSVCDDISIAVGDGVFSTTSSVSGETATDIQEIMNILQQLGYTVSLSSTTLTISW